MKLTDQQYDAFKEIVNIAVGQAADVLSMMIEKKINITVPTINLLVRDDLIALLSDNCGSQAIGVSIAYDGVLAGKATLFFSNKEGKSLVARLLSVHQEEDWSQEWVAPSLENENSYSFSDSDKEAISEIGNMLINALLGSVSNMVDSNFTYQIPELSENIDFSQEFAKVPPNKVAFVIETNFSDDTGDIKGYLFMLFDIDNHLTNFITMLDKLCADNS
ncbi:MAG: chemotaxis protein CheC [SAR324 cluster bacterium]|nr:chemotaxis protein CheC [SAR324 cluster bacterium]